MNLVEPEDILKANPLLAYWGGENMAKFIMYVLRYTRLNKIYDKIKDKKGLDFIDALVEILKVSYKIDEKDLKKIIKKGPFIIVCNHPYGGLDGILLIKILALVRPDLKIMANFLLKKVKPISEFFLPVNPFENRKDLESSFEGIKSAFEHLKNGGCLCLFPAGEVSSYDGFNKISDCQWKYSALKFIKKAAVPVVPVYFSGKNSLIFHIAGLIHPTLKTIKLPSELLNKKNKPVIVRIGSPISVSEQDTFPEIYQYGRYLRAKTYSLGNPVEVKHFFNYSLKRSLNQEPVMLPQPQNKLIKEVARLNKSNFLFKYKSYSLYCAPSQEIPYILNEIGRLREITFRQIGEGTNRETDLDEFDLYYNQLFIWDDNKECIVGGYRIGKGADIVHEYGIGGFYSHSLFKIKEGLIPILKQSLELGRSFIIQEYQRKSMSLFLLWKGVLYFLMKNPEYRYLIGPVSISNNYSTISKELIIRFIMTHYFDWNLARFITPRKAFKFKSKDQNMNIIIENMDNINKLDKFIGDVEDLNTGLPVLLKRYIKLNAKIIGFNIDPKFNKCLDGFLILDVYDIPESTIESLSKEVNDGSILNRFYWNRE